MERRSARSPTSCSCPAGPGTRRASSGFVATSQRRKIFVNAARVAGLDSDGVRLRSWDLDLHPFKRRPGETLVAAELIDRTVRGETVSDVGLVEVDDGRTRRWDVAKIRLARRNSLRRRSNFRLVEWREVPELWAAPNEAAAEAARLRDMHPSDVAGVVRVLPLSQRRQLAEAMDDDRLADLLEELPEEEQLRLIEGLDLDRLLDVLDEMEYDDLADLLNEMPAQQRTAILEAMDDEEAEVITRLLSYEEGTAGGMLTPEVIIMSPDDTVAEALAQLRDPDWTPSIASQVFVCRPPAAPAHRQVPRRRVHAAAAARAAQHGAVALHQPGRHRAPRDARPGGVRGVRVVRHARDAGARRGRPAGRCGQRRRRRRPHARFGVAAALAPQARRVTAGGHQVGIGLSRMVKRRSDLTQPRQRGRLDVSYSPDAFGQFSESIARFIGTARFLVYQTIFCFAWVAWNYLGPDEWRFDEWQFVGLTLLLSLQAAYAAPLILLAQTRQERRDRIAAEQDRDVAERTQADTEFLAREIASVRLALADVVTGEELRDELESLTRRRSSACTRGSSATPRPMRSTTTPPQAS